MNYIQNNTLPEIAAYGRSLGDSLGQAMYAVPQQRAQIAMQLAQARQQQQQAMLEYALKQQGQQQQQQYQQNVMAQPMLPLPQVDMNQLSVLTNPNDRKQFVGNAIYQIIETSFNQSFAGRITGMLIDENVIKFEDLLTNQKYFTEKSYEAYHMLMA